MKFWLVYLFLVPSIAVSGEIAFTFDDAPTGDSAIMTGVERTDRLLEGLRAAGVPDALFFVTTKNIDTTGRARLNKYVKAGFHLGNHSHTHHSANKLKPNEFMADVYQAHLQLKTFDNTLPYFRFPYLHYGSDEGAITHIQELLSELNYKNGYVTVDNFDWYMNALLVKAKEAGKVIDYEKLGDLYVSVIWQGIEFYDGIAKTSLGRSPRHVLLLHENDTSALFLPRLVKHIRAKGWTIITPQKAYQESLLSELPRVLFHKQGRIAAQAHAKGVGVGELRHKSENTVYLDQLFSNHQVFK